jgi:hypothetical protein
MHCIRLIAFSLCLSLLAPSALALLGLLPCAMGQAHAMENGAGAAGNEPVTAAQPAAGEQASAAGVAPCHGKAANPAVPPANPGDPADASCCIGCGLVCAGSSMATGHVVQSELPGRIALHACRLQASVIATAPAPLLRPPITALA